MNKIEIRLLRKNTDSESSDDILRVYETDSPETFRLTFKPTDYTRRQNEFQYSKHQTMCYISDILKSLAHDIDPFDRIQVTTSTQPAVMYDILDLEEERIRHLIEDMIHRDLGTRVHKGTVQ